jgi:tRNA dimethylallyltransferase
MNIPIICGPTASGKTSLALEYARLRPIEIISADSRQIIRKLDIGTAKPTAEERSRLRFHLLDVIEPGERYSAFRFVEDASKAIEEILARDRLPVVVGGTGLYLRALSEGVVEIVSEDMAIRDTLDKELEEEGATRMHERLRKIDPLEAAKIHPNNKQRVLRALEIYYLTGKTKSELIRTGSHIRSKHAFDYLCLLPERKKLYAMINGRVDAMIKSGLVEEIKSLAHAGFADDIRKANVIGYSELLDYIDGNLSLHEAVAVIKQNTRRYAKRQITWFRKQKGCRFFSDESSLLQALYLQTISDETAS